jgi:putative transcriptional regulator
MDPSMTIHHVVAAAREYREALGLSQHDFAVRFGLHHDTYRAWENGRSQPDRAAECFLYVILRAPDVVAGIVEDLRPRRMPT